MTKFPWHSTTILIAWAADRFDLHLTYRSAKKFLLQYGSRLRAIESSLIPTKTYDMGCWEAGETFQYSVKFLLIPFADADEPMPRPEINPRRINYPLRGKLTTIDTTDDLSMEDFHNLYEAVYRCTEDNGCLCQTL